MGRFEGLTINGQWSLQIIDYLLDMCYFLTLCIFVLYLNYINNLKLLINIESFLSRNSVWPVKD
jgi:hypothetical protein